MAVDRQTHADLPWELSVLFLENGTGMGRVSGFAASEKPLNYERNCVARVPAKASIV